MRRNPESIASSIGAWFHTFTEEEIQAKIENGSWSNENAQVAREHTQAHKNYSSTIHFTKDPAGFWIEDSPPSVMLQSKVLYQRLVATDAQLPPENQRHQTQS